MVTTELEKHEQAYLKTLHATRSKEQQVSRTLAALRSSGERRAVDRLASSASARHGARSSFFTAAGAASLQLRSPMSTIVPKPTNVEKKN